jgi:hypothetical protein
MGSSRPEVAAHHTVLKIRVVKITVGFQAADVP